MFGSISWIRLRLNEQSFRNAVNSKCIRQSVSLSSKIIRFFKSTQVKWKHSLHFEWKIWVTFFFIFIWDPSRLSNDLYFFFVWSCLTFFYFWIRQTKWWPIQSTNACSQNTQSKNIYSEYILEWVTEIERTIVKLCIESECAKKRCATLWGIGWEVNTREGDRVNKRGQTAKYIETV